MSGKQIRQLIGIYSASATMMCSIIPVSILAGIAKSFPDAPLTQIQLIVSISSVLGIAANFIVARLAHVFYRRTCIIGASFLYLIGGMIPFFFHESVFPLLVSASIVGLGFGGVQNGASSIIIDCFDGDARVGVNGLTSCFLGLGGVMFTTLASRLGSIHWHRAYLAYLAVIPLLILEFVFLPKGNKEDKPSGNNPVSVSREALCLCVFGFFMCLCCQIFNSNIAMLITERGLGGTVESGIASAFHTISVSVAGLLVLPLKKLLKNQSITLTVILTALGCSVLSVSHHLPAICIAAILMASGYATFLPIAGVLMADTCGLTGLAFHLALLTASQSLGTAISPIVLSKATAPFGSSLTAMIICGILILAVLAVVCFFYYRGRSGEENK